MTDRATGTGTRARALYVGTLTPGSTSRMRADWLQRLRPQWTWDLLDTAQALDESGRVWRSLAFRLKTGRAVSRLNGAVRLGSRKQSFDVIWVDKGVFLYPETVKRLRASARTLVHFTADTAFYENRSRHFRRSLSLYDLAVTTKSFEVAAYERRTRRDHVFLTTQGYDPALHRDIGQPSLRRRAVGFVGFAEPDREECVRELLGQGIEVQLAGRGWRRFADEYARHPGLQFLGDDLFGDAYVKLYSEVWVGLGLLTKRIPERHTTRTLEIPACGAILATERNEDTASIFGSDSVLFFTSYRTLASQIVDLFRKSDAELVDMAIAGQRCVETGGYSYPVILESILTRVGC